MHGEPIVQADCPIDADRFRELGFAVVPDVLTAEQVEQLRAAIRSIPDGEAVRRKKNVYGIRNLFDISEPIRRLASLPEIRQIVAPILGDGAFATRAIFFDKVPGANWTLGWHQDSVIAVRERRDLPGFIAWGQKAGVWQVQPPPDVLGRMAAVRVHLDDCGPENGPLRVIPGSHRHGWVEDDIASWKSKIASVACVVRTGGCVVMCPLILHASSAAGAPTHRRVIHMEFANEDLPGGLQWQHRIAASPRLDAVGGCIDSMVG
jgi:ectoine hydroxylase-related dioxygenase (phytanoyl-CoA dioxygenase family)